MKPANFAFLMLSTLAVSIIYWLLTFNVFAGLVLSVLFFLFTRAIEPGDLDEVGEMMQRHGTRFNTCVGLLIMTFLLMGIHQQAG